MLRVLHVDFNRKEREAMDVLQQGFKVAQAHWAGRISLKTGARALGRLARGAGFTDRCDLLRLRAAFIRSARVAGEDYTSRAAVLAHADQGRPTLAR